MLSHVVLYCISSLAYNDCGIFSTAVGSKEPINYAAVTGVFASTRQVEG